MMRITGLLLFTLPAASFQEEWLASSWPADSDECEAQEESCSLHALQLQAVQSQEPMTGNTSNNSAETATRKEQDEADKEDKDEKEGGEKGEKQEASKGDDEKGEKKGQHAGNEDQGKEADNSTSPVEVPATSTTRTSTAAGEELSSTRPATSADESSADTVRILHLSDTHGLQDSIEDKFPLPKADILIHTGDFTNLGNDTELSDANAWLGKLASRYKHVIVIIGNHDWGCCSWPVSPADVAAKDASFWRSKLSNAKLLWSETVTVMGLKIVGFSWKGDQSLSNQVGFDKIPDDTDILLTHGPAYGILDFCGQSEVHKGGPWGSSKELLKKILSSKPKVHLFGHDHEQRGVWQRESPGAPYGGGVEYSRVCRGSDPPPYVTSGPPPVNYGTEVISNNAMKNQANLDSCGAMIVGPPRLIIAKRKGDGWHFHSEQYVAGAHGGATCGNITHPLNVRCRAKVIWAASEGKNSPNAVNWWGKKMRSIAGVPFQQASQGDFQRIYYCKPPAGEDCGLPPCGKDCSKPPCDRCA